MSSKAAAHQRARPTPGRAEPFDLEAERDAKGLNRFAHDFSRIPARAGSPSGVLMRSHEEHSGRRTFGGGEARGKMRRAQDVLSSPGRPLEPSVREEMESKLGHAFSAVRVHDDSRANASARALGANAYTVGRDVVFGRRMSGFHSGGERELLAHELVHVAQSGASASGAAPLPTRVSSPTDAAEREADRLSRAPARGATQLPAPRAPVSPGTLLRQQPSLQPRTFIQTVQAPFYDPNFCYRAGSPRDATHPDRTKTVAVMQAQIVTPATCDGTVVLRTSVLQSGWGAVSANFEACGGGLSQGIYEGILRDDTAERVDYEEHFNLDGCSAYFDRAHLITFTEAGVTYTFAEAVYRPRLFPRTEPGGATILNQTPSPQLRVEPCDHIVPTLCGSGGSTGASTGGPPGAVTPPTSPPAVRRDR